ncbi:LLM class F420-dependent oxidoreductase [Vineibacter terrae]|uniref:LLM class F420-dependent oxidoreductase n=1 Tax=Vineibacter terrae TaxID=2586908 RepID=UPI002E3125F4|nr:LLM class F420-dependent oxidoreductase [Vineibacter terrae]HEX2888149.1 LLM class F420-dependent oxidoreductase [Vineibacter terrae]
MQIGFNAPTAGPLSTPENLTRLVVECEAMGFDYATFSDHVVIPSDIQAKYPYSATGEFPAGARAERHEQLTEVAFLAAKTSRLRLVTSVMVVPHRPAVLTAKILSTIDVLSGGRLTVGIGAGWLKEEFEALEAPDFAARGAVTDDYLDAFIALWTQDAPRHSGPHVRFGDITFAPKPVQKPHPPIWVGGESGPALRRTARIGTAWYPIGTNPAFPLDSLARLGAGIARLRKLTGEAGRDPQSVGVALRVHRYGEAAPPKAGDGERYLLGGSAADMAADLRALRGLGVGHVDFDFGGATVEAVLDKMQRFRREVASQL